MKQFIYLFRGGDEQYGALSPEDMQNHMQKWSVWMEAIKGEGDPLTGEGKVVEKAGSIISDGPFTEGKEIVGGYVLLPADDLNQAVELSKGCPIFEMGGSVEVREIAAM